MILAPPAELSSRDRGGGLDAFLARSVELAASHYLAVRALEDAGRDDPALAAAVAAAAAAREEFKAHAVAATLLALSWEAEADGGGPLADLRARVARLEGRGDEAEATVGDLQHDADCTARWLDRLDTRAALCGAGDEA